MLGWYPIWIRRIILCYNPCFWCVVLKPMMRNISQFKSLAPGQYYLCSRPYRTPSYLTHREIIFLISKLKELCTTMNVWKNVIAEFKMDKFCSILTFFRRMGSLPIILNEFWHLEDRARVNEGNAQVSNNDGKLQHTAVLINVRQELRWSQVFNKRLRWKISTQSHILILMTFHEGRSEPSCKWSVSIESILRRNKYQQDIERLEAMTSRPQCCV